MRIGVDVDGVLRDFVGQTILMYSLHFPHHKIIDRTKWKWNLIDNFPEFEGTKKDLNKLIFYTWGKQIMLNAPAYPGAIDALRELNYKSKHDIIIVTNQYRGIEHYTLEWLGKHGATAKEIYFIYDKTKANCDILIDDKVENIQAQIESGKTAIQIVRPWNEHWKSPICKEGFKEAAEYINSL